MFIDVFEHLLGGLFAVLKGHISESYGIRNDAYIVFGQKFCAEIVRGLDGNRYFHNYYILRGNAGLKRPHYFSFPFYILTYKREVYKRFNGITPVCGDIFCNARRFLSETLAKNSVEVLK